MTLFTRLTTLLERARNGSYQTVPSSPSPTPMPGAFPEPSESPYSRSPTPPGETYRGLVWSLFAKALGVISVAFVMFLQAIVVLSKLCYRVVSFNHSPPTVIAVDPIDKVNRFVLQLEDSLGANRNVALPPFFQGSYTQALFMATQRARFLFVYLTNPNNESSASLFHKVITNPEFVALCSQEQSLIWAGDLTNPEAYQLANSLGVTKFPFLGLMCLTRKASMTSNGPVNGVPKITLVSKIQGGISDDVDVAQLIRTKFHQRIEKHRDDLEAIKLDLRNKFMSQLLTEQQEYNYKLSLERDRAKRLQKEYDRTKKQYLAYRIGYFKGLQADSDPSYAKVAIRMPDGSRARMQFPPDETVEIIFEYVELLMNGYFERRIEGPILGDAEARTMFANFTMAYTFRLSSPVPPRVNLGEMRGMRIRDVDLVYPNGSLMVENEE